MIDVGYVVLLYLLVIVWICCCGCCFCCCSRKRIKSHHNGREKKSDTELQETNRTKCQVVEDLVYCEIADLPDDRLHLVFSDEEPYRSGTELQEMQRTECTSVEQDIYDKIPKVPDDYQNSQYCDTNLRRSRINGNAESVSGLSNLAEESFSNNIYYIPQMQIALSAADYKT